MAFSGSLLCAAPQGGQVRAGQAQITQQGKVTNINQSSQKAAINWQKFNIAADETVNFKQPNAHSVTLNRVIGNEKSVINGAMNANGKVFLLNPHGTLIGKGAKINVGGLVASTANISDDDFMQGKYRFTGNGSGVVENYGEIAVPAGGVVALIAPIVKNNGNIKADSASVLLASAEHFSITLPENGDFAYTIDKGTLQGLVDNGGAVLADGGLVVLTAAGLDSVKKSVVRHTGIIQANTVANKNGKILLLGDLDNSRTEVSGVLSAEAPISGDGGFIETSANQVQIDDSAFVSTKATNGKTGEWLIDPADYTVAATGGDITGQAVSNALQNNNLTLKSTNGKADGKGDVIINDTINWNKNTLTLNAQNDIHINKTINGSGSAKLALQYGQASADGGESNYYLDKDVRVNLPAGQNFSTQKGKSGEVVEFEVIHKMPEITHAVNVNDEIVSSVGQFDKTSNIAIGKDIDLSYTKNYSEFNGYGAWDSEKEQLKLDGLGHQLSHLTINNNNGHSKGFIARTYDNQELELSNIHLRDVDISAEDSGSNGVGGLLGYGKNIKIRNSSVDGKISGSYSVGGLVGNAENISISDSFTKGEIKTKFDYGGGIAGDLQNATINNSYSSANAVGNSNVTNSYATGNVSGGNSIGGLVGYSDTTIISNSYATGNVSGGDSVGGLIGYSNTTIISNSYATGDVSGEDNVGGLVGYSDVYSCDVDFCMSGSVSNSYATGNVSGVENVGGLLGYSNSVSNSYATGNVSGENYIGGLVGYSNSVSNSYATGDVSGVENVGGLLGYSNSVSNSYATGNVSGERSVGGLVGCLDGDRFYDIRIEDSYATGTLTHKDNGSINSTVFFGGLAGVFLDRGSIRNSYFSGSLNVDDIDNVNGVGSIVGGTKRHTMPGDVHLINVYFDNDKSNIRAVGSIYSYGDNGLTTVQMKDKNSFKDFDFENVWEIKDGQKPTLKNTSQSKTLETWDFENVWELKDGQEHPTLRKLIDNTGSGNNSGDNQQQGGDNQQQGGDNQQQGDDNQQQGGDNQQQGGDNQQQGGDNQQQGGDNQQQGGDNQQQGGDNQQQGGDNQQQGGDNQQQGGDNQQQGGDNQQQGGDNQQQGGDNTGGDNTGDNNNQDGDNQQQGGDKTCKNGENCITEDKENIPPKDALDIYKEKKEQIEEQALQDERRRVWDKFKGHPYFYGMSPIKVSDILDGAVYFAQQEGVNVDDLILSMITAKINLKDAKQIVSLYTADLNTGLEFFGAGGRTYDLKDIIETQAIYKELESRLPGGEHFEKIKKYENLLSKEEIERFNRWEASTQAVYDAAYRKKYFAEILNDRVKRDLHTAGEVVKSGVNVATSTASAFLPDEVLAYGSLFAITGQEFATLTDNAKIIFGECNDLTVAIVHGDSYEIAAAAGQLSVTLADKIAASETVNAKPLSHINDLKDALKSIDTWLAMNENMKLIDQLDSSLFSEAEKEDLKTLYKLQRDLALADVMANVVKVGAGFFGDAGDKVAAVTTALQETKNVIATLTFYQQTDLIQEHERREDYLVNAYVSESNRQAGEMVTIFERLGQQQRRINK